jgi:endoglucanase
MKRSSRKFSRTPYVRLARNSAIGVAAMVAATQTAAAMLPGVANALNRLAGMKLFVNTESPAQRQANEWRRSRPADAALMERIASQPVAKWMGNWNSDIRRDVASYVTRASQQGATAVLVAYNIPSRDCGSYSAGGSAGADAYRKWIRGFAAGLGGKSAIVVLEPDAVPGADCLSASARQERYDLLRDAIQVLKGANAVVYLDAGNSRWLKPEQAAERLEKAGLTLADGFSLNVSNYQSTSSNIAYGEALSRRVGGKHFIIDTSRNGIGGSGSSWCNVKGQSLGDFPTTNTGHALVDALLWIKQPGESDGECNGGPRAGGWWPDYALGLAQRATQVASR